MELMMCGGLLTITYKNSAESIPLLLFGQSKGPLKIAPNYVQLRQGRRCQSSTNFPPSLHSSRHCTFSLGLFFLWGEESANMILCTRCVTMEKTGVSISLSPLSLFLWQAVTCWLSQRFLPGAGRSVPNPAAGQRCTRAAPLQSRAMKFGNKCHSGAKQLLSSRQAKPILSFWIMIMQNSVTRITGDESLSLSLLPSNAWRLPPM